MLKLCEVLEVEKSVSILIAQVKEAVIKEIKETPLKNVQILAENIVIVKFSALERSIWSPEYYIPKGQADLVERYIGNVETAHSFVKKMEEMIQNRRVVLNSKAYPLNDTTVSVLKKYYKEV